MRFTGIPLFFFFKCAHTNQEDLLVTVAVCGRREGGKEGKRKVRVRRKAHELMQRLKGLN